MVLDQGRGLGGIFGTHLGQGRDDQIHAFAESMQVAVLEGRRVATQDRNHGLIATDARPGALGYLACDLPQSVLPGDRAPQWLSRIAGPQIGHSWLGSGSSPGSGDQRQGDQSTRKELHDRGHR